MSVAQSSSPLLDDWTFSEVGAILRRARLPIVLITAVCAFVALAVSVSRFPKDSRLRRTELAVQATFAGADSGQFPNTQPFTLSSFIAPGVVAQAALRAEIGKICSTPGALERSLSVAPGTRPGQFALRFMAADGCGASDREAVAALDAVLRAWIAAPETARGFISAVTWPGRDKLAGAAAASGGTPWNRQQGVMRVLAEFAQDVSRLNGKLPEALRGGADDPTPALTHDIEALAVALVRQSMLEEPDYGVARRAKERTLRDLQAQLRAAQAKGASVRATLMAFGPNGPAAHPDVVRELNAASKTENDLRIWVHFYVSVLAGAPVTRPAGVRDVEQQTSQFLARAQDLVTIFDVARERTDRLRFGRAAESIVVQGSSSLTLNAFDRRRHVLIVANAVLLSLLASVLVALVRERVRESGMAR